MEIHNQDEALMMGSKHIFKGKRTKRQRSVSSFVLTMETATSSCSSGPEISFGGGAGGCGCGGGGVFLDVNSIPSLSDSGELAQSSVEEEDMANCLILLAQGSISQKPSSSSSISQHPNIIINRPASATAAAADVYQCKTCNRSFPSFQALGGHRASHKKAKVKPEEKKTAALLIGNGSHESSSYNTVRLINQQQEDATLSLQILGRSDSSCNFISNSNNKSRVHECSICGAEFSSGQALGGHMRRHRPLPSSTMAASSSSNFEDSHPQEVKKHRTLLSLDLNLPASPEPGDEEEEDCPDFKYPFASKQEAMVFSASPLVNCHY